LYVVDEATNEISTVTNEVAGDHSKVVPVSVKTVQPAPPVKYQYYQSSGSLSLSVLAKGLSEKDITVQIGKLHLRVIVHANASTGRFEDEVVIDKDLFAEVDTEKSKFVIFKTKVEITLGILFLLTLFFFKILYALFFSFLFFDYDICIFNVKLKFTKMFGRRWNTQVLRVLLLLLQF
jgi:hypothetical protein